MKQTRLVKMALFLMAAVLLSGCVFDGDRGGDWHDHGDQHDHPQYDHDHDGGH